MVALTLSLTPLRASHDEWWHLKTGRYIDEHGLPENEIFTYTAENIAWHNHEWLAQVGLWRIYKWGEVGGAGGVRAVIFFKAAVVALTFIALALFMARQTGSPAIACLAAGLAVALSRRTLYPRPPFITYALLAVVVCAMIAWRARKFRTWWLLLLAPLFAIWANLHGGFMAGLVVIGAFWGESLVDWMLAHWRMEDSREPRRRFAAISGVLALSFLATFATPYGYHLYELAGRVMSDTALTATIYELLPANWRFVWALDAALIVMLFAAIRPRSARGAAITAAAAFGLFFALQGWRWITAPAGELTAEPPMWETWFREIAAIVIFTVAAARSKASVGLAQTVLVLFFAHQAIQHVRHLPLFAIVFAPVMAQTIADWLRGTVGGWDWLWRIRSKEQATEEYQASLRDSRIALGQLGAFVLLAATAIFYLFLPQEAVSLVVAAKTGEPSVGAPAQTMLDRNLALLRDEGSASHERGTEPRSYPKRAVDFLIANKLPPRLWNGGNYAGYLIWRLSPEHYKVFTDNRYDIYGGLFVREEWIVLNASEGDPAKDVPSWRDVLDKWNARTLFIPTGSKLNRVLTQTAIQARDWKPIYQDPDFSIWTRGEHIEPSSF